jgi:hypothetical protein
MEDTSCTGAKVLLYYALPGEVIANIGAGDEG